MAIDPVTAMLIVNTLGGIAGGMQGNAQNKLSKEQLELQKMEQMRKYGMAQENQPLRDKVLYMLNNAAIKPPGTFQPRGLNNQSGQFDLGGVDQAQQQQHAGAYKPGAGGTNPALLEELINKLRGNSGASGFGKTVKDLGTNIEAAKIADRKKYWGA